MELKLKSRVVGLSKKLNLTTDNTDNTDLHGSKSSNVQQDYFRSLEISVICVQFLLFSGTIPRNKNAFVIRSCDFSIHHVSTILFSYTFCLSRREDLQNQKKLGLVAGGGFELQSRIDST